MLWLFDDNASIMDELYGWVLEIHIGKIVSNVWRIWANKMMLLQFSQRHGYWYITTTFSWWYFGNMTYFDDVEEWYYTILPRFTMIWLVLTYVVFASYLVIGWWYWSYIVLSCILMMSCCWQMLMVQIIHSIWWLKKTILVLLPHYRGLRSLL